MMLSLAASLPFTFDSWLAQALATSSFLANPDWSETDDIAHAVPSIGPWAPKLPWLRPLVPLPQQKATKTPEWDFFFHFVQTYHFNFHKTWDQVTFKNTSIRLYNICCHLKGNQITILKDLGNHKKLGEPLRKYTVCHLIWWII